MVVGVVGGGNHVWVMKAMEVGVEVVRAERTEGIATPAVLC